MAFGNACDVEDSDRCSLGHGETWHTPELMQRAAVTIGFSRIAGSETKVPISIVKLV
jgi:hypothetical protein